MRFRLAALAVCLTITVAGNARVATQEDDGVGRWLARLEQIMQRGDVAAYDALLGSAADRSHAGAFIDSELLPGMTRTVIQERDRRALAGTLPGNGYSIIVDIFQEFGDRGRISTWSFDVKRAGGEGASIEWLIADQARLSAVEDLYRLSLSPAKQFKANNLQLIDEDLELTLREGSVFVSEIDRGTTAVVFIGTGDMAFRPAPETEKSQLRIFGGAETMQTRFDAAYLRINPGDFDRLLSSRQLVTTAVDPNELRKADRIFREDSPKSYMLDLGDLSRDMWAFVPNRSDFIAEIHTRRFDTLTYSRSSAAAEDISLFDRNRRKTIALYASQPDGLRDPETRRLENRPELEVQHYDIDVAVTPERRWIEGRARLTAQAGMPISSITLRLANSLAVQSVVSDEYGRLFSMRVTGQNTLVVSLPATLSQGSALTLTIRYAGRLEPAVLDADVIAAGQGGQSLQELSPFDQPEPSFLYSGQSNWYPRPSGSHHATATLRITVPASLACVASGEPHADSPILLPVNGSSPARKEYAFTAAQPVRYLAFIVSRFATSRSEAISFLRTAPEEAPAGPPPRALQVSVEANPGHASRGRDVAGRAGNIARFYESLLHDSPYPSLTIALTESERAGGHSPGYFAVLNVPPSAMSFPLRNDPASFEGFPDFFLAHELAHQWWGQAVGWRSYHDQWLSEGFSQYFAALYARHQRGDDTFRAILRQMRRWAIDESKAGPISLGNRLGHIQNDSRIFRALVYNKSALVLHMLRHLVGDDAFFGGLRRFYDASRFRSVGTTDFRTAMEAESGRPLARFFDQWIYGSALPRLNFSYDVDGSDVVLHVEQRGEVFDVPLMVTLQYADRPPAEVLMRVTDRVVDLRVPLAGTLRGADVSRDPVSLAEMVRN